MELAAIRDRLKALEDAQKATDRQIRELTLGFSEIALGLELQAQRLGIQSGIRDS